MAESKLHFLRLILMVQMDTLKPWVVKQLLLCKAELKPKIKKKKKTLKNKGIFQSFYFKNFKIKMK